MKYKNWLSVILPLHGLSVVCAFDMYPWGKYDFKENSADLLDGMRENEHLKMWDSTLSSSLLSGYDSLLIKNSEGNTFELKAKPVGKALTTTSVQMNDIAAISAALQTNCAILIDGYWSYEWCHMKEVRQFHLEQKDNLLHRGPDWSLGKESKMVTIREKHDGDTVAEAKTRPVIKIVEYFEGGQRCDETGEGRSTEVHIVCCEGSGIKNFISAAAYYASLDGTAPHSVKLPAATLASITEPDLCSYEVTVCSPLMCKRPSEVLPVSQHVALQDSLSAQLTPIMKYLNTTCLNKQEDWWTYELCFNSGLRQVRYDIEQVMKDGAVTQKQVLLSQYQLGIAPIEIYTDENELRERVSGSHRPEMSNNEREIINGAGMVTPTFRTRGKEPRFLRLDFPDGTPCDLDEVNRSTVVDLYCGKKNRLVGIWEDSTCHYHAKVELTTLCSISDFMPYKENTTTIEFLSFETDVDETEESMFFSAQQAHEETSAQEHGDAQEKGAVDSEPTFEGEDEWTAVVSDDQSQAFVQNEEKVEVSAEVQVDFEGAVPPSLAPSITDLEDAEMEDASAQPEEHEITHYQDLARYTEAAPPAADAPVAPDVSDTPVDTESVTQAEPNASDIQHEPVRGRAEEGEALQGETEEIRVEASAEVSKENPDFEQHDLAELRTRYPDFDVTSLVMQLEAAAAALDQPFNLSRSAMVELIESAIAQLGDRELDEETTEGKGAPKLVVKYAFIADDEGEPVAIGSGDLLGEDDAEKAEEEDKDNEMTDVKAAENP